MLFVTANVHKAKFNWLKKHGFLPDSWESFDYACVHWKDLIIADTIVDDRTTTIEKFKGRAILFDRPHNRSFRWEDRAYG